MSRHDRDAVSLMGGLLLVLLAGAFLLADLTSLEVDGRWVAPLVLVAVGAAGVLATLRPRVQDGPERIDTGSRATGDESTGDASLDDETADHESAGYESAGLASTGDSARARTTSSPSTSAPSTSSPSTSPDDLRPRDL